MDSHRGAKQILPPPEKFQFLTSFEISLGGTRPERIPTRPPPVLDHIPLHSPLYGRVSREGLVTCSIYISLSLASLALSRICEISRMSARPSKYPREGLSPPPPSKALSSLQGYLAHKKAPPPRTLQDPMVVVGGGRFLKTEIPLQVGSLRGGPTEAVQGYLAHKKPHPPLGLPWGPGHSPTVGS